MTPLDLVPLAGISMPREARVEQTLSRARIDTPAQDSVSRVSSLPNEHGALRQ